MVAFPGKGSGVALGGDAGIMRARSIAGNPRAVLLAALEREWSDRRFFLWLPVCAGAGVVLYFTADREPSLWIAPTLASMCAMGAAGLRRHRVWLALFTALATLFAGFAAAGVRTASVSHATVDHVTIVKLAGFVEELDRRQVGARFILRVWNGPPVGRGGAIARVRLTTRRSDPLEAGDFVTLTARLVPPSHAAMPDGYDFARDAFFAGFDAVGSVLGRIATASAAEEPSRSLRLHMGIDRARNTLATRVSTILDGDIGAIGAAMVTGKRDLLSEDGRDLIREAGIFHIITIAGVQMTLVAGLLFGLARACLAAIPAIALRYPIKVWSAIFAMTGSVVYDLLTGSRVGTQRALIMTLIMLGAVLAGRRGFTMRNLAFAAFAVILLEPETILGASFQLSFAAVSALVAVQEGRFFQAAVGRGADRPQARGSIGTTGAIIERGFRLAIGARRLLVATLGATSATAPFMAGAFHELSPYVIIGNPLTLGIIEFFAVPGALLGAALYPLGLDHVVWHWVGWGIRLVLWAARLIATAPGSTLHLAAFAPWSTGCFALALASIVIWRGLLLRMTAVPLLAFGLYGAAHGPRYDLLVAPRGDAVAFRDGAGRLSWAGRPDVFGAGQWLSADGDARDAKQVASTEARCDSSACVAHVLDGRILSVVLKPDAFEEDCQRADLIVTPLYAPASCGAEMILDRGTLAKTGAVALSLRNGAIITQAARESGEDRPWSPAPIERFSHDRPGFQSSDRERSPHSTEAAGIGSAAPDDPESGSYR